MIDFCDRPTPNGRKVSIMPEETGPPRSIADKMSWPAEPIAMPPGQGPNAFLNVSGWSDTIWTRSAAQKGVDMGKNLRRHGDHTEASRRFLFGRTARTVLVAGQ